MGEYDPLLRRFLNVDENIQDPHNTQNYNKYAYVLNNPLMFNDPSGEFIFAVLPALIIGAVVGVASYTIGLAITGNLYQWNLGGALKSALLGGVSFGVGEIFSSAAKAAQGIKELTKIGKAIQKVVGEVGLSVVRAGTHAVSQGVLAVMQGTDVKTAMIGDFLGSLGADAWGGAVKGLGYEKFAESTLGTVAFGVLSGGIGAELTGGNFWQGAVTVGIVAGLNHAMHKIKIIENNTPPKKEENNKKSSTFEKINNTLSSIGISNDAKLAIMGLVKGDLTAIEDA